MKSVRFGNTEVVGFLCDSVRAEVENKTSLIGLLPGTMNVTSFPFLCPFGIFLEITPAPLPGCKITISITYKGVETATIQSEVPERPASADIEEVSIRLGMDKIILNAGEPGDLEALLSLNGSKSKRLAKLKFRLTEETPVP